MSSITSSAHQPLGSSSSTRDQTIVNMRPYKEVAAAAACSARARAVMIRLQNQQIQYQLSRLTSDIQQIDTKIRTRLDFLRNITSTALSLIDRMDLHKEVDFFSKISNKLHLEKLQLEQAAHRETPMIAEGPRVGITNTVAICRREQAVFKVGKAIITRELRSFQMSLLLGAAGSIIPSRHMEFMRNINIIYHTGRVVRSPCPTLGLVQEFVADGVLCSTLSEIAERKILLKLDTFAVQQSIIIQILFLASDLHSSNVMFVPIANPDYEACSIIQWSYQLPDGSWAQKMRFVDILIALMCDKITDHTPLISIPITGTPTAETTIAQSSCLTAACRVKWKFAMFDNEQTFPSDNRGQVQIFPLTIPAISESVLDRNVQEWIISLVNKKEMIRREMRRTKYNFASPTTEGPPKHIRQQDIYPLSMCVAKRHTFLECIDRAVSYVETCQSRNKHLEELFTTALLPDTLTEDCSSILHLLDEARKMIDATSLPCAKKHFYREQIDAARLELPAVESLQQLRTSLKQVLQATVSGLCLAVCHSS